MAKTLIYLIYFTLIASVIFVAHGFNPATKKLDKIRLDGKWFVDSSGRVNLLRGINAVQKSFPWVPDKGNLNLKSVTQLENLQKWGFNVVRLGVMWSGVIPEKNFINETYLNEMESIINKLASYGIYTLIDLHQDMMSSKFGSYDGVPLWVLNELPRSKFEYPWPIKNSTLDLSGFSAYLTEACGFSFQCLYKDSNNFGGYFNQFWSIVAKKFTNNTAILGYELLNEPWAGDIYTDPLLLLPSVAGHSNLLPFYDRAHETIRKYDSDTLIFYEPVTWGVLFEKKYFGSGFNRPPGNDINKTVFSWHYYCWLLALDQNPIKNGSYPEFYRVFCDNVQLFDSFEAVKGDMLHIGNGASFLTEFGVCAYDDPSGGPGYLNTQECESVLNANDKYLVSWAYWDSNFYLDTKAVKINEQLVKIFSRVYPVVTNGVPEHLMFDVNSKEFSYTFTMNLDKMNKVDLATEIFIPKHVYLTGFNVTLSSHLTWDYRSEINLLIVELADSVKYEFYKGKRNVPSLQSTIKLNPNN